MLAWRLNWRNAEQNTKSAFTSHYRTALPPLSTNPFLQSKLPLCNITTVFAAIIQGEVSDSFIPLDDFIAPI
jgi:hypothetical protein